MPPRQTPRFIERCRSAQYVHLVIFALKVLSHLTIVNGALFDWQSAWGTIDFYEHMGNEKLTSKLR